MSSLRGLILPKILPEICKEIAEAVWDLGYLMNNNTNCSASMSI